MRSLELFAGAGGLGMGVCQAGFKPAAVIEWDRYCCDTIRENQERQFHPLTEWPLIEGDVRDQDFRQHESKIDLVTGGPPCQPFSLGGKHRAHQDHRDMFSEAVRAIRETRPRAFVFENVKGLTRAAFANYFEYIRLQMMHPEVTRRSDEDWESHLSRLRDNHTEGFHDGLEYQVFTRVLNAADYGVPQRRERVFFVGFRSDLNIEWFFPSPTHSRDALLWRQFETSEYWDSHEVSWSDRRVNERHRQRMAKLRCEPCLAPWQTVRDALVGLPDPESDSAGAKMHLNHHFQGGARSYTGHTGSPLDEPAKTLKAGVHGVPGGENMLLRPDGSIRYFTVRETARLQTFCDEFLFHGSWTETMRQLGNAVPIQLAAIVTAGVASCLEDSSDSRTTLQSARQGESGKKHRRTDSGTLSPFAL